MLLSFPQVLLVLDWKTEKVMNSDWGRDWAPVAVPIYKRYKQTNNRM